MFFYKTGNSSSTSQNFQYQTPVTSLGSLPVSPTSSIRTRPLFLPSPSVQIGQYAETSDEAPTRKRKERPEYSFDSPARCSKRRYTEPEVIDIDDDDNWHSAFANTGYQDARRPRFSVESSIAHSEDEEDSGSQFSTNTHSNSSRWIALPEAQELWMLYQNPICSGALRSGPSGMGLSPI
ncbi:hypothetical protein BN14_08820 [Rhizoctonia solani AG-1 IB]|uniref:Uncharacterized protein n=1 Tax=Thanatephorus cucumeris (strain AG1-IB / isolate 7/3/14) TaxID=1108050 RepID=M5C432_THACB|nr:hypothetical protein BN14_08820 [Rhizoctonia solani AG-1 IB]